MPRFVVQGWRRVAVFEQSSTEIEASNQQAAIEQAKARCAKGELGWLEQAREEQDFRWSAESSPRVGRSLALGRHSHKAPHTCQRSRCR